MRIGKYRLSHHAAVRMVEMGLTATTVEDVLNKWVNRYEQPRFGEGRFVYQKGAIAVATSEVPGTEPVILTVLWNKKEQWKR